MRGAIAITGALIVALASASAEERIAEEVDLTPAEHADWGLRNVGAAVTSVFGAWGYWYGEHGVYIDTAPASAQVDLFYIRANFQKMFVRAGSPVRVRVPPRIRATSRDSLIVRVSAPGFQTYEESHRILDLPDEIVLSLEPLPNALVFLGHSHIGGRTTLEMRTTEKPEFRVTKSRGFSGFSLIFVDTANNLDPVPAVAGGLVKGVEATQLGEDLVVRVEATDPGVEVRTKEGWDPIRREHVFSLDLAEAGRRAPGSDQIRRQVSAVGYSLGDPCHLRFEQGLRDGLAPETLVRTFRGSGSLADLYRREAMLHLGRLDHGEVRTLSGESYRIGSPIELEAALQTAPSVEGYLGLLGAYARAEPDPPTVIRSLVAPELDATTFGPTYESAESAWQRCRQTAGR
jgi:hypothetical protein